MSKKILTLIIYESFLNRENILHKTIKEINKFRDKHVRFYVIDLSKYFFFAEKFDPTILKKYKFINYYKVKKIRDIIQLGRSNKLICIGPIKLELKFLIIYLIIKLSKMKRIFYNNYGLLFEFVSLKNYKFRDKLIFIFFEKISYYFMRVLSIINLIPSVDYYFETSQIKINKIRFSLAKKISNKFLNFSYYKKIYRINSIWYDQLLLLKKKKFKKKFVIFVDPGIDHPDRKLRFEKISEQDRESYYNKVNNLLSFYKKKGYKVVFSKHPKSFYPTKKQYFLSILNSFKVIDYLKASYFNQSSFLIMNTTTLMNKALLFKKNVLFFETKLLGSYMNDRLSGIKKIFTINFLNLDDQKFNAKTINNIAPIKNKQITKFVNLNLVYKKNITSNEQLKFHINRIFLNQFNKK